MGKYTLKLTSSVAIDGGIRRAGSLVDVDEQLARDLMRRGKAEIAGQVDLPADEPKTADGLAEMTKAQLMEVAAGLGIENANKMNKTQLLEAINKYEETDQ